MEIIITPQEAENLSAFGGLNPCPPSVDQIVQDFSLTMFWPTQNNLDPAIIRLILKYWNHATSDMINWKDNFAILIWVRLFYDDLKSA